MDVSDPRTAGRRESPLGLALLMGLTVGAVGWSYAGSFQILIERWQGDDNYGHGWFVIPIALAILWHRKELLPQSRTSTNWLRFLPLLLLLASRVWLFEKNEQWIECASIPFMVAALVYATGGWPLMRWAWPAVIFLFFMIPIPPSLNDLLAGQLQTIATYGSVNLLHALGMAVISEGNVILVHDQRLEVAEACRGLSMLLSFATLITAMVILVARPLWERIVLLLSIVPIALVCNIIRIAVTAIVYAQTGKEVKVVHDWAGLAMMPLALALVLLEMKIMSWLVVEVEIEEPRGLLRATYGPDLGPRS